MGTDLLEMVALIVVIIVFASVIKGRYGAGRGQGRIARRVRGRGESGRPRDEMAALKDRVAVLERIAVDKETSLSHEIERLRDRPMA